MPCVLLHEALKKPLEHGARFFGQLTRRRAPRAVVAVHHFACAMKGGLDVRFREVERFRGLGAGVVVDIAQNENTALLRRQRLERKKKSKRDALERFVTRLGIEP